MTWNGLKGNPRARLFIQEQTAKECNVCFAMTRGDSVSGLRYLRIKKENTTGCCNVAWASNNAELYKPTSYIPKSGWWEWKTHHIVWWVVEHSTARYMQLRVTRTARYPVGGTVKPVPSRVDRVAVSGDIGRRCREIRCPVTRSATCCLYLVPYTIARFPLTSCNPITWLTGPIDRGNAVTPCEGRPAPAPILTWLHSGKCVEHRVLNSGTIALAPARNGSWAL